MQRAHPGEHNGGADDVVVVVVVVRVVPLPWQVVLTVSHEVEVMVITTVVEGPTEDEMITVLPQEGTAGLLVQREVSVGSFVDGPFA